MKIRIGTRASRLAQAQTQLVVNAIGAIINCSFEIVHITTTGDRILDRPLYDIGGKALFLKEIEEAMLAGKIDMAVHSMKDVPGKLPDGLEIAAVLEREDPRDVLISDKGTRIGDLPLHAKVGTSSVRRRAQMLHIRPDLEICEMRGNVNTRLDKWRKGNFDAIVIALAGIKRLNLYNPDYCHILNEDEMLPAVGQGVIAIEIRSEDEVMRSICDKINHIPTWQALQAERGFLEYLDADCRTPLAALAKLKGKMIEASYMLCGTDLKYYLEKKTVSDIANAYEMGTKIAKEMIAMHPHDSQ